MFPFRSKEVLLLRSSLPLSTYLRSSGSMKKYVRKFLAPQEQSKKKRVWHEGKAMSNPSELANPQGRGEGNTHRLQVLNKVFLDKIVDLLSTSDISTKLQGLGIEISKVRVLPNMDGINVYWVCSGCNTDDMVAELLDQNAMAIRHQLSQLRVIGRVPIITFVKDHRFYKCAEVERRLAYADFGKDFEPTDATHHLKTAITLKYDLDEKIKKSIELLSNEDVELNSCDNTPIPFKSTMRYDILGVDTKKIYEMVQQGKVRSRGDHRKDKTLEDLKFTSSPWSSRQDQIEDSSLCSRSLEIKQWAKQYELTRKRKERRSNNVQRALLNCVLLRGEIETEEPQFYEEDYFDEEFVTDNDTSLKQ